MSDFSSEALKLPADTVVQVGKRGHEWGQTNILVQNSGRTDVFLGGKDVSPSNGYLLRPGEWLLLERVGGWTRLWAYSRTTPGELRILRRDV